MCEAATYELALAEAATRQHCSGKAGIAEVAAFKDCIFTIQVAPIDVQQLSVRDGVAGG